ncbi:MAG: alpha/beta hydrolase domain-containing protein [Rhodospirillaceae bacterium]
MRTAKRLIFSAMTFVVLAMTAAARAEVDRIEILERAVLAEGRAFGGVGPYERLRGKLYFILDANAAENQAITDIRLAPRDAQGRVHFSADIMMLRPVDGGRANGRVLFEASAAAGPAMLSLFNDATNALLPISSAEAGNGFLMDQGYTLLWIGWNWDVLPGDGRLRADLPLAMEGGKPLFGRVISEIAVTQPTTTARATGSTLSVGYEPARADDPEAVLTMRETATGPRMVVPRERWIFGRRLGGRSIYDPSLITLEGGFKPGAIYTVSYFARGPRVAGLGFAAVRDALLFFHFERFDRYGGINPIVTAGGELPRAVIAFGHGEGARALQTMLYHGLSTGAGGRLAFDGALLNVAGAAKGPFNHRFGQGARETAPDLGLDYPNNWYPFATAAQPDGMTNESRSVLDRVNAANAAPRLFYVNSSTEYWTQAASLTHTTIPATNGQPADLAPSPRARIYAIAGGQQRSGAAGERLDLAHCINPLDYRPVLRSLLLHLDAWITLRTEPPTSELPTIAGQSLTSVASYLDKYPKIPGTRSPSRAFEPARSDFGGRFLSEGIVDVLPPRVGRPYPVLVPQVDGDGLETAGIRLPDVTVPLGTYVGWNPQNAATGAPDRLSRTEGSFIPFPRNEDDRLAANDPRRSIAERYPTRDAYAQAYAGAALSLAEKGMILGSDINPMIERAGAFYDRLMARDPKDTTCGYLAAR